MATLIGVSVLGLSIAIATDVTDGAGLTAEFWIIVAVATVLQPVAFLAIVGALAIRDGIRPRGKVDQRRTGEIADDDGRPDSDGFDSSGDSGGDSGDY